MSKRVDLDAVGILFITLILRPTVPPSLVWYATGIYDAPAVVDQ